jgi:glycosyltransferase involved in cell wall biosynthesis
MMEREEAPQRARSLRVCYFGTFRAEYSRNRILMQGLRRSRVEVIECHVPLWRGIQDRVRAASGGWLQPAFFLRAVKAYARLLVMHHKTADYDVMLLGYPGQIDVFLARLLTWVRRRPLALDIFMSTYLIAAERGLVARHAVTGHLLFGLEKLAYRLPDRLLQDTPEYVDWLCRTFGLKQERFRLVPTGADDVVFQPVVCTGPDHGAFCVLYYGSFIPNHDVGTIVAAARLLRDRQDIRFELIGDGPDRAAAETQVREWGLTNVKFVDWAEQGVLARRAAAADLCLGAFGTTPQSLMTIQNKIYECLAVRRPVLTGDSPAVRRALQHGKHVWLCERSNPRALADSILKLEADAPLRESLAENGRRLFLQRYTTQALGKQLRTWLEELVR